MNHDLLTVRDLRVAFRIDKSSSAEALKGVSFSVPRWRWSANPAAANRSARWR
jgi:ABC-type glutathione transport system ATPase component